MDCGRNACAVAGALWCTPGCSSSNDKKVPVKATVEEGAEALPKLLTAVNMETTPKASGNWPA